jgi:mono/diheme cytochrome c family protein
MRRLLRGVIGLAVIGAGLGWVLSGPDPLPAGTAEGLTGDAANGALIFAAAGCGSCHRAPDAVAVPGELPLLTGGRRFVSGFGTFLAPNISPSPEGIGDWTDAEILNAVMRGVLPDGAHVYPALPYDAYAKADVQDMVDLIAYLRTLPPDATPNQPNEIGFPFSIRRAVGLWKLMSRSDAWVLTDAPDPQVERGRYLVEALGHCGECHTPRNALGGLQRDQWLAGAPNPSGEGRIPNITPGALSWSATEIAGYLQTGFTPDFDVAGGEMAEVVRNTSQLTAEDRAAIAAYLKAVPAIAPPA